MSDRPLPLPDPETAFFWDATARGKLEILRCQTCRTWVHYPKPSCWNCSSMDLKPEEVSGRGTVYSYTVTHQDVPGYTAPFAVVIVELEEQAGLRMVSNVVDVPPEDVRIGMPVEVTFEQVADDVTLPMFKRR